MIGPTEQRLVAWARNELGAGDIVLAPPEPTRTGAGVSLYLLDVVAAPAERMTRDTPLQLGLRYLVTAWADDPSAAHDALGTLAFAAMADAELDVELAALSPELWRAFGVVPQPGFFLRVPVRVDRATPTPLVTQPLVARTGSLRTLTGEVRGPGDVPIPGATVEIVGNGARDITDDHGRFSLPNLLSDRRLRTLRVVAKGAEHIVALTSEVTPSKPLVVHINPLENHT